MFRGKILPGHTFRDQLAEFVISDPAGAFSRSNAGLLQGCVGDARDISVYEPSPGKTEPIRVQQRGDDAAIVRAGGTTP